jgi:hypothetical protein
MNLDDVDKVTEIYLKISDLLKMENNIEAIDGPGGEIIRLEYHEGYRQGIAISLEIIKEIIES